MKRRRRVLTFSSNTPYPLPASTSLYQVFVHNLPRGISTEELARAFRNCGAVNKVEILDYSAPEETKEKQVARIRQTSAESKMWVNGRRLTDSYGFVHFEEKAAREKALIPAMRIFGVQIRNSLCRTGGDGGGVRRRAGGEQADALRREPRARNHRRGGREGAQRHSEAAPGD